MYDEETTSVLIHNLAQLTDLSPSYENVLSRLLCTVLECKKKQLFWQRLLGTKILCLCQVNICIRTLKDASQYLKIQNGHQSPS